MEAWKKIAWGTLALSLVLRLVYLGLPELIPEEAYYWLYARNLDWGYLDHPPMVAWLIWIGTSLFGHTEFGVRAGALLCWLLAAGFLFELSCRLYSRSVAWLSVGLFAVLPYFISIGFTISPDSPLVLCWIAALCFLERALLGGKRLAWYAVGLSVGAGLLSKYTIVLLGPATLLFCWAVPSLRHWFRRLEPYLAGLIALAAFSPVLYWNSQHDWASFAFQGPRRLAMPVEFSLHQYLLDILVLLSPAGWLGAFLLLGGAGFWRSTAAQCGWPEDRKKALFILCYLVVPAAVFALYSVRHEPKLNWAGPSLLILLPCLAQQILTWQKVGDGWLKDLVVRSWKPSLVVLFLMYWVVLQYLSWGFPGVPLLGGGRLWRVSGWADLGNDVSVLVDSLERQYGSRPIIVGMDKHYIGSELSFYTLRQSRADGHSPERVRGRELFGFESLMFRYWDLGGQVAGKNMVLVARNPNDLAESRVAGYFARVSAVNEIHIDKQGDRLGSYYYRVGEGFKPSSPAIGFSPLQQ